MYSQAAETTSSFAYIITNQAEYNNVVGIVNPHNNNLCKPATLFLHTFHDDSDVTVASWHQNSRCFHPSSFKLQRSTFNSQAYRMMGYAVRIPSSQPKQWLRHSSPTMIRQYSRLSPSRRRRVRTVSDRCLVRGRG